MGLPESADVVGRAEAVARHVLPGQAGEGEEFVGGVGHAGGRVKCDEGGPVAVALVVGAFVERVGWVGGCVEVEGGGVGGGCGGGG